MGVWAVVLFLAGLVLADDAPGPAAPAEDRPPSQADRARAKAECAATLRTAVRQAIKHLPKRGLPTADAVRELVQLYQQLKTDESLPASERQRLLVSVRTRLVRIHRRLVQELGSQAAADENDARDSGGQRAEVRRSGHSSKASSASSRGKATAGDLEMGEADASPRHNAGGASALDNGQQLVELIQEVISPDIWDVNGGPAVIRYYAPLKVLVVTAPGDVHGDVGAVLDGLRQAGP
jgi:hypothetical protein